MAIAPSSPGAACTHYGTIANTPDARRELIRLRSVAMRDLRRSRQQLLSFPLRSVRQPASADGLSGSGAVGAFERQDHPPRTDHQDRQQPGADITDRSRLDLPLSGEGATALGARIIHKPSAHLPEPISAVAWKAQVRLSRRYHHLIAAGKAAPKVITAIARELVGFIWAIARMVEPKTA